MFNWLPLSARKNIVLPKLVIEPNIGQVYGGYYSYVEHKVVVVDYNDEKLLAAALAHEFKHVTQHQLNQNVQEATELDPKLPYEKLVHTYFNYNSMEMEALLYECKYAKNETNDWWLNHLVRIKNPDLLDVSY